MATARKKGRGYEIRVSCGIDINGKKLGKSKIWIPDEGMTPRQIEKELERQKVLFEEEVKNGICPDNKMRFADFSKRWMEEYAKVNLTIKTYARYPRQRIYRQRCTDEQNNKSTADNRRRRDTLRNNTYT